MLCQRKDTNNTDSVVRYDDMFFRTMKHVEIFNRSKGPYFFDKTYAYSLVLRGLTMKLTTYIM